MSNEGSYVLYQCTWWVAKTLAWVPGGLGNAYEWYQKAQAKGYSTGDTPMVGAVAVWDSNLPGSGGFGHVAAVQSINPDGSFVVSEANYTKPAKTYGAQDTDTRTVPSGGGADFMGFIYPPGGADASMSGLSYGTLEQLWTEAGGPSSAAATAAAIAIAESSGNPNDVQQGQPYATQGWGLWQITPGNSEASIGTDNQLLDPLTNAKAAVAKFNASGGNFSQWTTYTGGEYKKYLNGTNYSGTGGLTSNQQSAANAQGAIFSFSLPVLGTVDMDGVVGTAAMVGGLALWSLGGLVIMATMLEGPLSQAAQMYAPVRAISSIQQRSQSRAQQAQMRTQRSARQAQEMDLRERRFALAQQTEARQAATEERRSQSGQTRQQDRQATYESAQRRAKVRYTRTGQPGQKTRARPTA